VIFQKVNKEKTLFEAIDVNEIVYIKGKKGGANVEVNIIFGGGHSMRINLSYPQFDELYGKFEEANKDYIIDLSNEFPQPGPGQIIKVSDNTAGDPVPASNTDSLIDDLIETTKKGGKKKEEEVKG